jgi:pimeloyl-ACP methyl ester carboxylesterase
MSAGLADLPLPAGIRSRLVPGINGLTMHVLEAGFEEHGRPCLLLLHGFPELAYSWRKVMLPLAQAGYHVVAPDQRGYGRTTGYDPEYDGDLASYRPLNLVRDVLGLVAALGYRTVDLVGHDFGSPVAAWCALLRPDVFKSVALMSAPFAGVPALPLGPQVRNTAPDVHAELAALPRPRKHYQWYYSTRQADSDMRRCKQGLHDFMRAYYHVKSADWTENQPYPLGAWSAQELAKLPTYYVMDLHEDMAQTVAHQMPTREQVEACRWMTEDEMRVYSGEFARTGFQAALQWYRCRTTGLFNAEAEVFAGRTIDVPSVFISGKSDWGPYQKGGDLEAMRSKACTDMRGCHFIAGAGHWVQQEQPEEVARLLLEFLRGL